MFSYDKRDMNECSEDAVGYFKGTERFVWDRPGGGAYNVDKYCIYNKNANTKKHLKYTFSMIVLIFLLLIVISF